MKLSKKITERLAAENLYPAEVRDKVPLNEMTKLIESYEKLLKEEQLLQEEKYYQNGIWNDESIMELQKIVKYLRQGINERVQLAQRAHGKNIWGPVSSSHPVF